MHILLIEPDKFLAKTYRAALERAGYKLTVSHDAQGAIHASDRKRPDLVLLELQLPGHNGIEFLYEFRSYAEWQPIPIILHTFVPRQHLAAEHFERLGIAGYLYKPVTTLQQLKYALAEALPVPA